MVTVSPENVKVEYVKTYLPSEEKGEFKNLDVAYTYEIDVRNVPNGVYLINIASCKYQFNRKIVANH
jgi:hypothetical protein